jgi:hypothetical protein
MASIIQGSQLIELRACDRWSFGASAKHSSRYAIADPANRLDNITRGPEFFAETADVCVDRARFEVGRIIPDVGEELFTGLHAAFTL